MKVLLNLDLAAHCLKANTQDTSIGRKERLSYLGGQQSWEEGGLMSQRTNSQLPIKGHEILKGSFRGCKWREWATCRTAQSTLTINLNLVMWWSDQCHLDCFKYS